MLGNLRGFEWVIIGALILLLFGAKRLPDAARGLGRSLRIFKAETKGLADDPSSTTDTATGEIASPPTPTVTPPAAIIDASAPDSHAASGPPAAAPTPERTEG